MKANVHLLKESTNSQHPLTGHAFAKVLTSPRILGHQNLLRLNSKVHKLHARLHGLSDVSNGLIVRPVTWLSLLQRDSLLGPQEGKSQI